MIQSTTYSNESSMAGSYQTMINTKNGIFIPVRRSVRIRNEALKQKSKVPVYTPMRTNATSKEESAPLPPEMNELCAKLLALDIEENDEATTDADEKPPATTRNHNIRPPRRSARLNKTR